MGGGASTPSPCFLKNCFETQIYGFSQPLMSTADKLPFRQAADQDLPVSRVVRFKSLRLAPTAARGTIISAARHTAESVPFESGCISSQSNTGSRDGRPVIPVLLPYAPTKSELPMFLSNRTWVDLREGLRKVGLDQLVWGITGVKPNF